MNSTTAEQEFDSLPLAVLSGGLPADLTGHMFVVAPAGTSDHPFGSGTPLLNGTKEVLKWKVEYQDGDEIKALKIEQTIHQMGLSADYIVLIDTAFKLNFDGVFYNPAWLAKQIRQANFTTGSGWL